MVDQTLPGRPSIETAQPAIRKVGLREVGEALALGFKDFRVNPVQRMLMALIYPLAGLFLAWVVWTTQAFPLLYPIAAGFALIGPFASAGLYEISRRRELGVASPWLSEFAVLRSPHLGAVVELGVLLSVIFVLWLATANALYDHLLEGAGGESISALLQLALGTRAGWILCAGGTAIGFLFAVAVFSLGVLSFPLLLDRDLAGSTEDQVATAVETSVRAVIKSPMAMAAWAAVTAIGVMIGLATALVGFIVLIPILGHATWHLYRKIVV